MEKKVKIWSVEVMDLADEPFFRLAYRGDSREEAFKHVLDQINEEDSACMVLIYQGDMLYNKILCSKHLLP